jgi:son of sevenless-like protein
MHINKQVLSAGTLLKIIEHVTDEKYNFEDNCVFIRALLHATDPLTLICLLQRRFNTKLSNLSYEETQHFETKTLRAIRARVMAFIKTWANLCPEDFTEQVREHVQQIELAFTTIYRVSIDLTKPKAQVLKESSVPIPRSIELKFKLFRKSANILDFDSKEIARQLTIIDHEHFCNIPRAEMLNMNWSKERRDKHGPGLATMIKRFNNVCEWVGYEILQGETLKSRVKIMEKIIDIGHEILQLKNMNGVFAIGSGLSLADIFRLKQTHAAISEKHKIRRDEMLRYLNRDRGFRPLRDFHRDTPTPCIPYIGLYLTDLTFIEEGSAKYVEHNGVKLINFCKLRQYSQVISQIQHRQFGEEYNLQVYPKLRALLEDLPTYTKEETFKISLIREPRNKKH